MNWQVFRSRLLLKFKSIASKIPLKPQFTSLTNLKTNLKRAALLEGIYNVVKPPDQLEYDVKKACDNTENAIVDLMGIIKKCIHEISEEYRVCLQKQIDIINSATELGPVGPHWDELVKYRVQANELKVELDNYRSLLKSIGNIAQEQSIVSLLTGAKHTLELIADKYSKLSESVEQEYTKNFHYELSLLYANRDHILRTGGTKV